MSFLSRIFRKAPSLSPVPASASQAPTVPKVSAADRALATAAEESALQSAIDARDVQAIARLVAAGSTAKIRHAAAHAIEDADTLRQLIRDVRGGNDKGVYKILTTKRDALIEQARKLEQLQLEIRQAAADLERLSKLPYDAVYAPTLDLYERQWQAVAGSADTELIARVQQWILQSRETIAEHHREVTERAAREQAAAEAAAETQRLRDEQLLASAAAAAEQATVLQEQRRLLAEKQQAEQQAVHQISGLIRKAREALSDGSTAHAAGVRRALDEKLADAPSLPANLVTQIQQLDTQIAELKDWKSFSVAPKRAELIEQMASLIGAALEPVALADKIKSLQDEWRSLSKGAGENVEADWQRFHAAAQQAYQPCSEYFAAQALVREENLRRRDAILAELTAFEAGHNWEQADWRAVTKILRDTKQTWYACSPVDRRAGKKQQEGFLAVTANLQGRMDAEYARNVKQKESLIERAQTLLSNDHARKAIDGIKELQKSWQTVGPVPRDVDQRLWTKFRKHCDAVFQKREQDASAHAAELENNKRQAIALCEQIEKIAALEGPELLEQARARVELRSAFEALGEFPRTESQDLRKRFDRGLDRCEKSLARQHARDAEHSWSDLFEAANQVRAYQLAVARSTGSEQINSLKVAAETFMASVQRWPKRGLDTLRQGLVSERSADLAANETALRQLCIRAEILTDTPTPHEDQGLRRDYQLQRLVENMGQGGQVVAETNLDALTIEWIGIGPVEEALYQSLTERFRRCCNKSKH